MSTRVRVWSVAVTVVAWVIWITAYGASKMAEVGGGHMIATALAQMIAGIGTIVCVILWLIAPVIATARVWHRIGMDEQQQRCRSCSAERAAKYADIIPLRFDGRLERRDN